MKVKWERQRCYIDCKLCITQGRPFNKSVQCKDLYHNKKNGLTRDVTLFLEGGASQPSYSSPWRVSMVERED